MNRDPVFKLLNEMVPAVDDFPCRVSADLRRHQSEQSQHSEPVFDHEDDALMHDVMGNDRLAKPVQSLLEALQQHETASKSFGADDKRTVEILIPLIKALREAVIDEWRQL